MTLGHPVQGAELVAVGVAEIGEIHLATGTLADPRGIFTGGATGREACSVPGISLF